MKSPDTTGSFASAAAYATMQVFSQNICAALTAGTTVCCWNILEHRAFLLDHMSLLLSRFDEQRMFQTLTLYPHTEREELTSQGA